MVLIKLIIVLLYSTGVMVGYSLKGCIDQKRINALEKQVTDLMLRDFENKKGEIKNERV